MKTPAYVLKQGTDYETPLAQGPVDVNVSGFLKSRCWQDGNERRTDE